MSQFGDHSADEAVRYHSRLEEAMRNRERERNTVYTCDNCPHAGNLMCCHNCPNF